MATSNFTSEQSSSQHGSNSESVVLSLAQRQALLKLFQAQREHQDAMMDTGLTRKQQKILGEMMATRMELIAALGLHLLLESTDNQA